MIPSPRDPSYLGALLSFERAAHHLSFAKAAADLGVTPSAVSHRIAALERTLQKRLFVRQTRAVRLTNDGLILSQVVAEIWARLDEVTTEMTCVRVLRVALGPYFSSNWLMPRLRVFEQQHPDARIDLVHATGLIDLRDTDVAILWLDVEQHGSDLVRLFDLECVPVAKPGLCAPDQFIEAGCPPLHYQDRATWRDWLSLHGLPSSYAEGGDVLDDPHLLFEAAMHGRGIAMGLFPFIAKLVEAGRLEPVSKHSMPSRQSYFLKTANQGNPLAASFAEWMRDTIQSETIQRSE